MIQRCSCGRFRSRSADGEGVYEDDKGYLRISAGPWRGVRVATLVAEGVLGRPLLPSEDVHHKNQNRKDPRWTNIEVLDHTEHGYVSAAQGQYMKRKDAYERSQWERYMSEEREWAATHDDSD